MIHELNIYLSLNPCKLQLINTLRIFTLTPNIKISVNQIAANLSYHENKFIINKYIHKMND